MKNVLFTLLVFQILLTVAFTGCKNYTQEEKLYIDKIEKDRLAKDEEMKNSPQSPFNLEPKVQFHPLKYFDADPGFVFKSKLTEYNPKDSIVIYGTKGEPRSVVRFGYLKFSKDGKHLRMNVYEGTSRSGERYHSLWFTDLTTNKESYGVGRYIDFEVVPDSGYVYTIDFNKAYNPYCSYSPRYSCAIPSKQDFLDLEITAGEKKFHED